MSGAARSPLAAVRLVLRIVLGAALVVLLALNGVKQAPRVLALVADRQAAPSATAPAGPAPSVQASATAQASDILVPTTSVPTLVTGGGTDTGTGPGGGTGTGAGGGGAGTGTKPSRPPAGPAVTSFQVSTPTCPLQTPGATIAPGDDPVVDVRWTSTGAVTATFTTPESSLDGFQPNDSLGWEYPCPAAQQRYTVTVAAEDGRTASRSVTVQAAGGGG